METAIRRMVLGTGSGVGKSLVVAGICRAAARKGLRVVPFKSQNMSNNSAALAGGGEIARAQALQARAARVEPVALMNPILLKPMEGGRCQVLFMGHSLGVHTIREYRELKKTLFPEVCRSFEVLARDADLVILEGAGSPAEINLLEEDIANTRMARAVGATALLLGDIEQGGVFAALLGTLELLPPEEREVIRWLAINKFRGDRTLLLPGTDLLSARTGRPFLGVMDHLGPVDLPDEDSFRTRRPPAPTGRPDLRLAVVDWPHLSNRSDLDPFLLDPGVEVIFLPLSGPCPGPVDAVILPGTRQTMGDLRAFRNSVLFPWFLEHLSSGRPAVGICGGYQMMGELIRDPEGVESPEGQMEGLALLPLTVTFCREKIARKVVVRPQETAEVSWEGYEIRHGRHELTGGGSPLFDLFDHSGRLLGSEGASNPSGTVSGWPVHGLFDNDDFRDAFYGRTLGKPWAGSRSAGLSERIDGELDRLADAVERSFSLPEFLGPVFSSRDRG